MKKKIKNKPYLNFHKTHSVSFCFDDIAQFVTIIEYLDFIGILNKNNYMGDPNTFIKHGISWWLDRWYIDPRDADEFQKAIDLFWGEV